MSRRTVSTPQELHDAAGDAGVSAIRIVGELTGLPPLLLRPG